MSLRLRRGPSEDRVTLVFQAGELVYDTVEQRLYVGDGLTQGGLPITDLLGDASPQLGSDLDLNGNNILGFGNINIDGDITASGTLTVPNIITDVTGSLFGDDSAPLVDGANSRLVFDNNVLSDFAEVEIVNPQANQILTYGGTTWTNSSSFTGNVTGNLDGDVSGNVLGDLIGNVTGDVLGNVVGELTGNVNGSVIGTLTGSVTGDVVGDVTGDVVGNVTGDVVGNVLGDLVGDVTGNVTGNLAGNVVGNVTGNVVGDLSGNLTGSLTMTPTGEIKILVPTEGPRLNLIATGTVDMSSQNSDRGRIYFSRSDINGEQVESFFGGGRTSMYMVISDSPGSFPESNTLILNNSGNLGIGVYAPATKLHVAGNITAAGGYIGGVQTLTGPGTIDLETLVTEITTTGTDAYTLANGTAGQLKILSMVGNSGNGTVAPTTFANGNTITFTAINQTITLIYGTTGWVVIANQGTTIA